MRHYSLIDDITLTKKSKKIPASILFKFCDDF